MVRVKFIKPVDEKPSLISNNDHLLKSCLYKKDPLLIHAQKL